MYFSSEADIWWNCYILQSDPFMPLWHYVESEMAEERENPEPLNIIFLIG